MINLEFYREKIKDYLDNYLRYGYLLNETFGYEVKYGENFVEKFIDWLLEEYKEPIKLKQWEYDLLFIYSYDSTAKFEDSSVLSKMKENGHFKGITDASMALEEIVNNCEVELE